MSYADRVKCRSCINGSGPHGCTDCLNAGWDPAAFSQGIEQALNDAYAEGRKDELEAWLTADPGPGSDAGVKACDHTQPLWAGDTPNGPNFWCQKCGAVNLGNGWLACGVMGTDGEQGEKR